MDHHERARLSDAELVATVERLARSEREASAALVAHLAEMLARRLHERLGYSSLYVYCVEVLRLSPDEAYDRMKAAKVARRFPSVLQMLADRELSLTTIRRLALHLTRQNHAELLGEASGRSGREVQLMLARRFPQPDVAPTIQRLPPPALPPLGPMPVAAVVHETRLVDPGGAPSLAEPERVVTTLAAVTQVESRPQVLRPLSPERFHIAFTGDAAVVELVELARDLLRHAVPSGDLEQIMARALTVLVEDLLRRKFAVTETPRARSAKGEETRYIPAHVKRAVYLRDRGRCTFAGMGGHRCRERGFVEFHHVIAYAVGGRATVSNLTLRCKSHNQLDGEKDFGPRARHGEDEVAETGASCGVRVFVPERKRGRNDTPRGRARPNLGELRRIRRTVAGF
jgi:hypothetical protein